ncbi:MAG: hypothetical protein RLY16_998 [Bacteroidota bacterium]|jgi:membrane-bound lytic murein transglycosylase D
MKKRIAILFVWLLLVASRGGTIYAQTQVHTQIQADTAEEVITARADEAITAVIKSRSLPKKEKVQYFSQVTRYGFKNLFSNSSYNAALPYAAQINPQAELFIVDYMRGHGKYLEGMKTWGQPYFNLIENVLIQYGLPRELKYIAVIESGLSTAATSNKGAGGPWQFMPYTAREMGLTVNAYIDERRDYLKSTHAAARYLLQLYTQLHDWLLVMAAYNGGPGRVNSAIKKSGSRNFWDLQYQLPEESRTYVKRFIATHYIMEGTGGITTGTATSTVSGADNITQYSAANRSAGTASKLSEKELAEVEMLTISGKYSAVVIAKNLTMNIAEFNHYNPGFDAAMASNGTFDLRLPPEKMQLFIANKFAIHNECIQLLLNGANMPVNKTTYNKPAKTKL